MFYVVTITKDAWDRFVIQRTVVTTIDDYDFGDHPWCVHHPFKHTLRKTYIHVGTNEYEAEGVYSYTLMKHRDHPYNLTKMRIDLPKIEPQVKKPRMMRPEEIERFLRECNQRGAVRSAETRAKMAAKRKGRKAHPNTMLAMAEARKGLPNGFKGKQHSEETKAKIRHTLLQRKWQLNSTQKSDTVPQ